MVSVSFQVNEGSGHRGADVNARRARAIQRVSCSMQSAYIVVHGGGWVDQAQHGPPGSLPGASHPAGQGFYCCAC
jgi:hypothetical protein